VAVLFQLCFSVTLWPVATCSAPVSC